ncbi:hypothetical protein VPH35_051871 [Triticum aestivum]
MANLPVPSAAEPSVAANLWPRAGNGPMAPLLGIPVTRIITHPVAPLDLHSPTTVPPSLSTPDGLAALRARLNEARADAAFAPSPPITQAARHARRSNMRSDLIPAIVAPPCLVNDVSHIAFAQLRTPIHNPTTLIHDAILAHAGNPSFSVAGSWRGAGCVTFESASVREYLVSLGSLDYRGNQISFQPVELADRASPVFDQLIEVKASEFPHELWHDDGIRWALSHLGDVCSIDHYCVEGRDFTAVRALIMVDRRKQLPDSLPIQLPPSNDIKVVKIARLATVLDRMGPLDPSSYSSDSDSDADSRPVTHGRRPFNAFSSDNDLPRAPPPSPTLAAPNNAPKQAAMPLHTSPGGDAHANLPNPVINISSDSDSAPPSQKASPPWAFSSSTIIGSSSSPAATNRPTPRLATAIDCISSPTPLTPEPDHDDDNPADQLPPSAMQLPSAFRPYDSSNSSPQGLDTPPPLHDCVLRKLRHSAKRSADKAMSLRRSSRLAAKEPRVFTDMTTKAVRARAARLSASDVAKALKDAIHDARLDIPDAPPASAAALAEIASLCGAGDAAAASIAHADDDDHADDADVAP